VVSSQTEVELKFLVPKDARAAIVAEMARGSSATERRTLAAMYLDTEDRRVARAGMAWRLRREGRRWVQTLKADGTSALERFEHEVIRPDASHDATVHAGTGPGDKLLKVLRNGREDGQEVKVRFRTEVHRTARRMRTRGAFVEVAFDEGRLLSEASALRISEVEFELISGSPTAMLALAERWRKRFGLIYDPRSKAERGDRLAEGLPFPPVRKASLPEYGSEASATAAFGAVIDECLAHISGNAIGLVAGDASLRVDHVHQLRVGIRRLRSALRSFEGSVPSPPDALVDGLRDLFATLGEARDSDVLGSGVVAALAQVGAPPLAIPAGAGGPDPIEAVKAAKAQQLLLGWLSWRASLSEGLAGEGGPGPVYSKAMEVRAAEEDDPPDTPTKAAPVDAASDPPPQPAVARSDAGQVNLEAEQAAAARRETRDKIQAFHQEVERRLRRWHRRIAADWKAFDSLSEESLHALRKRIKRQRYAVEFFSPVLRKSQVKRYLRPVSAVQDRMGKLNDLFVARTLYQNLVASDPAAWFALGWLAAHIAEVRASTKPELKRLAKAKPPET
jgi:triphosphatase